MEEHANKMMVAVACVAKQLQKISKVSKEYSCGHNSTYSRLSNKRDGWNKCDGRKIWQNFGPKIHSPPTNFKFKCVFEIF